MKYRSALGSVTVNGPPAMICCLKIGTTLALLPNTLPNRTEMNRVYLHKTCPRWSRQLTAAITESRQVVSISKSLGSATSVHRIVMSQLLAICHLPRNLPVCTLFRIKRSVFPIRFATYKLVSPGYVNPKRLTMVFTVVRKIGYRNKVKIKAIVIV